MKRILLLLLQTSLKIAIILANSAHSCFLRICKVITDVFQLQITNSSINSQSVEESAIPHDISFKVSISTQTEESNNSMEKSGTDVFIHNLNSTQTLFISQENFLRSECNNCHTQILVEKTKDEAAQTEYETPHADCESLENDVTDSNLKSNYSSCSNSSRERVPLESTRDEFNCLQEHKKNLVNDTLNVDNIQDYDSDAFNKVNPSTCSDRLSLDLKYLNKTSNATYVHQNTSSPLATLRSTHSSQAKRSLRNARHPSTRIKDTDTSVNADKGKRRLSLPVKLNTTNSAMDFKLVQQKLIEETLRYTPRHEKSVRNIKYPFSSDMSLDGNLNDVMDGKEVFSCSSYESLPISDHLRNAFENNNILNVCNETPYEKVPDLFSIDMVEEFNDAQSFLSVENISQRTIIPSTLSKAEGIGNDSSYVDKNLHQSSLQENSLSSNTSEDYPKQTKNFKKRIISSFNSKANEFNNFIGSEMNSASEKSFKLFEEEPNNLSESEVNSESNVSDMNESEPSQFPMKNDKLFDFPTKNDKLFDCPNLKQEIEEALEKYAVGSGVSEDFENDISSAIDRVEIKPPDYHKNFYRILYQTETDTSIHDENSPNERNQTIQNISGTSHQNFLNDDDKTFCRENFARNTEKETSIFDEYDEGLLLNYKLRRAFENMADWDKNQTNKMKYTNELMLSDQCQWCDDSETHVLMVKSEETDNSEQAVQSSPEAFDGSLLQETTNQCLSGENCQNKTLKDEESGIHQKRGRLRSRNKAKKSAAQQQLSCEALLTDEKSPIDENGACKNILDCQEHEDEKSKHLEKNISSGDSDNSVVTVKDLNVEDKTERASENGC